MSLFLSSPFIFTFLPGPCSFILKALPGDADLQRSSRSPYAPAGTSARGPPDPWGGGGQTQAALTDVRTTPRPYVCGPSETQSLHVQAISRRPPLPGHNSHPLSCETANHINTRLRPAAVTFVTIYRYTSTYYRQRALAHECPPTKRTHSEREAPAPCTFVAESK